MKILFVHDGPMMSNAAKTIFFGVHYFVFNNRHPKLVEISYGFSPEGYDSCPGYWDKYLNWHEGKFDAYGWMVEELLKDISRQNG